MKKAFGILILIIGIGFSILFGYMVGENLWDFFQYQIIEWDLLFKNGVFLLIGIFYIVVGIYMIRHKEEEKQKFIYQKNGRTYAKLGGSYTVGYNMNIIILGCLACIFWFLFAVVYIGLHWFYKQPLEKILILIFVLVECLLINIFYFLLRPRIVVHDSVCLFLPRWEKRKVVKYDYITSRQVSHRGLRVYITYYVKDKELITIPLKLTNAMRFDVNVYKTLEDKKKQNFK